MSEERQGECKKKKTYSTTLTVMDRRKEAIRALTFETLNEEEVQNKYEMCTNENYRNRKGATNNTPISSRSRFVTNKPTSSQI